jgi:hypothetical protein
LALEKEIPRGDQCFLQLMEMASTMEYPMGLLMEMSLEGG